MTPHEVTNNQAGLCARRACGEQHDNAKHKHSGYLYCVRCARLINSSCGETVVVEATPVGDMTHELGALLIAWVDRGISPFDSAHVVFLAGLAWLAERGTPVEDLIATVRSAHAARSPNLEPGRGAGEEDNEFTLRMCALVDVWRTRNITRVEFEAAAIAAGKKREPELVDELGPEAKRGSA